MTRTYYLDYATGVLQEEVQSHIDECCEIEITIPSPNPTADVPADGHWTEINEPSDQFDWWPDLLAGNVRQMIINDLPKHVTKKVTVTVE